MNTHRETHISMYVYISCGSCENVQHRPLTAERVIDLRPQLLSSEIYHHVGNRPQWPQLLQPVTELGRSAKACPPLGDTGALSSLTLDPQQPYQTFFRLCRSQGHLPNLVHSLFCGARLATQFFVFFLLINSLHV